MHLISRRFSGHSTRKLSPPRERLTISVPIPIQTTEVKEHHVVCTPLSSHPVHYSKSDADFAKRHSGSPERPKGRNSASERPPRPDEKEDGGEDKQHRNRRRGKIFTKEEIGQIFADGKKAVVEESKHHGHRSRSTSTSSRSSDEDERRRDGKSRSQDRNDSSSSRKSGGRSPSRERESRMELVEGREVKVRGCNFTLVTKRRPDE